MNRSSFIKRFLGGIVAATVAPLVKNVDTSALQQGGVPIPPGKPDVVLGGVGKCVWTPKGRLRLNVEDIEICPIEFDSRGLDNFDWSLVSKTLTPEEQRIADTYQNGR